MKKEEYKVTVLTADDGKILTDDKTFGKTIRFKEGDNNPENWREIDETEVVLSAEG